MVLILKNSIIHPLVLGKTAINPPTQNTRLILKNIQRVYPFFVPFLTV